MLDFQIPAVVTTRDVISAEYTLAPALKEGTSASSKEQGGNDEEKGGTGERQQGCDCTCKCSDARERGKCSARKRGAGKRSKPEADAEPSVSSSVPSEPFHRRLPKRRVIVTGLWRTPEPRGRLEPLGMAATSKTTALRR